MKILTIETRAFEEEGDYGILNEELSTVRFQTIPYTYNISGLSYVFDRDDFIDKRYKNKKKYKTYVNGYKIIYL